MTLHISDSQIELDHFATKMSDFCLPRHAPSQTVIDDISSKATKQAHGTFCLHISGIISTESPKQENTSHYFSQLLITYELFGNYKYRSNCVVLALSQIVQSEC